MAASFRALEIFIFADRAVLASLHSASLHPIPFNAAMPMILQTAYVLVLGTGSPDQLVNN